MGTDFEPKSSQDLNNITTIKNIGEGSSVVVIEFSFPQNPSTEELDQIFRRLIEYRKGLVPVSLQAGDSVVKQFVLCTRHWLFFTPLAHQFQIQVNYSIDGIDHAETIAHQQVIRSSMKGTVIGGISGAIVGTLLKSLSDPITHNATGILTAALPSVLAAIAVVVAFARKAGVQPVVSVEDFFGVAPSSVFQRATLALSGSRLFSAQIPHRATRCCINSPSYLTARSGTIASGVQSHHSIAKDLRGNESG